jgi:hypothetical protein
MELKLHPKTLVIGIALGVIISFAIGSVSNVYYPPQVVPIKAGGTALVKTQNGIFYIVSPSTAMAPQVLEADIKSGSDDVRRPDNPPFTDNSPNPSR